MRVAVGIRGRLAPISTISLLEMSDGRLLAIDSHDWYWLGSFFKGGSIGRKPCSKETSYCSKLIDGAIIKAYTISVGVWQPAL